MTARRWPIQYWLLAPLAAAYFLQGAKTGLTFLPLFLLSAACIGWAHFREVARPAPERILWPFILFLIWSWMALLTGAPLDVFLFYWSRALLYVAVGVFVYQFAAASTPALFEKLVMVLGGVETALIIYAKLSGLEPQTGGLLRNSLHSGILLPVAFALTLYNAQRHAMRSRAGAGLLAAAAAMAVAIFLLRSRSGLLSVAAIVIILYRWKALGVLMAGAALATVGFWLRGQMMIDLELDAISLHSTLGRIGIWKTALDAILHQPMTGFGLGNFESAYLRYQHPSGHLLRYSHSTMFAHNGLLQTAAETGFPGLALLVWGLFQVLRSAWKNVRQQRGLFLILVVFGITALFNYSLLLPFNGLIFAMTVGFLVKGFTPAVAAPAGASKFSWPFLVSGALGLIFLSSYAFSEALLQRQQPARAAQVCPIRSDAWYALALSHLRESKDPFPALDRALIWNSQNAFYWQRKAVVLAHQKRGPQLAEACFQRAQTLAPFHTPFYLQEGFYFLTMNQPESALTAFNHAAMLEPAAPLPHYGLSLALQRDPQAAAAELAQMKTLSEQLKNLEKDPERGALYRDLFNSEYARYLRAVPS